MIFLFSFSAFQAGRILCLLLSFYWLMHLIEEQLENESFSIPASINNMFERLGILFKHKAYFKIQQEKVWSVIVFVAYYLDFIISSLLIHDPKDKILYTEPIFFFFFLPLLSTKRTILLRNSFFVPNRTVCLAVP